MEATGYRAKNNQVVVSVVSVVSAVVSAVVFVLPFAVVSVVFAVVSAVLVVFIAVVVASKHRKQQEQPNLVVLSPLPDGAYLLNFNGSRVPARAQRHPLQAQPTQLQLLASYLEQGL